MTGRWTMLQGGAATALSWAINAVRKGGNVSIVGVYGPTFNAVPIGNALNKGLTLRMNRAAVKRHVPHLIEHIRLASPTGCRWRRLRTRTTSSRASTTTASSLC